ncbi:phage head spike fiber domain-containing protein [Lichenicoccus sp.]|uniref:phage head spike fiber domain-containing protein n=1 Tax=Lichenicoccus sp. TaxID=2781899 RepID=UPI003D09E45E
MIPVPTDGSPLGTTSDMAARLRATLPTGWFPTSSPAPAATATPVLDGLLSGLGAAWSFCFGLLGVVAQQTRVATASGSFLDIMASDFFGATLARHVGESDTAFRSRISASLLSQRATRKDVIRAVVGLTGLAPLICEPTRAQDCGGYGGKSAPQAGGGLGYGVFGLCYGSTTLPFQFLVNAISSSSFAPNSICTRQSSATFLDQSGWLVSAAPFELRPLFQDSIVAGALLEARGFNLITDSRSWRQFSQPPVPAGSGATWSVDGVTPGILAGDPVLTVVGIVGSRVVGPSIDVAAAGAAVVGSTWVFVPAGSGLTAVELAMTDLNSQASPVYAAANMSLIGKWQRLSASVQLEEASGRNLRVGLLLSSTSGADPRVSTQCWQVEPGTVATSYIPTSGALGIRAEDGVIGAVAGQVPSPIAVTDIQEAVVSAIPAATIAWMTVTPTYPVG